MLVRLDPRSEDPIYLQISDSLLTQIDNGALESGDRLPGARDLAGTLGVNMHTVLKAYARLDELGYVEMRRGRAGVTVRAVTGLEAAVGVLITEARKHRLSLADVESELRRQWS